VSHYRNAIIVAVVLAWIPVVLAADSGGGGGVSPIGQRLLGAGTWLLLLGLLALEPVRVRAQVAVVVAFATLVEYTFSYELHVYVYRLHNVPWYVPPGHGLVYLGALAIGRSALVVERSRAFITATIAAAGAYAAWGLIFNGRHDVLGVLWFGCLVFFLFRAPLPTVFVGAFVVVSYLELIGTGVGAWTWQTRDPILHWISMGNPPTGAAGGYGFFDAAALALAPRIEATLGRRRLRRGEGGDDVAVEQPVAADRTPAVSTIDA
jgi:hypothetical protein